VPNLAKLTKCKSCSGGKVAPRGATSLAKLAGEYLNDDDGMPSADFRLLAPLKRSDAYGAIRHRVAELKPVDAWSLEGLNYFVFALHRPEGSAADPYALFVMNGETQPVSALVVQPNGQGAEADVEDLRNPGAPYKMQL